VEMVRGLNGNQVRVLIPRGAGRNEIVRVSGEGLPKPRGGRGDLLVRITYQVAVKFARAGAR
jgi:DnaJ-class molecular chaperone